MKTIEVKIYSFDELSEEAQKKAINSHSDINVNSDWWESVYYDAKQTGLKITSFDLERNRHAKGNFILSACEVAQNILSNHGENCETFKTAACDYLQSEEAIKESLIINEFDFLESGKRY